MSAGRQIVFGVTSNLLGLRISPVADGIVAPIDGMADIHVEIGIGPKADGAELIHHRGTRNADGARKYDGRRCTCRWIAAATLLPVRSARTETICTVLVL